MVRVIADVRLHAMRRALLSLLVAVLVVGATTVGFLVLEPAIGPSFAFWPGFIAQDLLASLGISTTNRILPAATVLFWWVAIWLGWSALLRGRQSAA
jgi:hypothetical protein